MERDAEKRRQLRRERAAQRQKQEKRILLSLIAAGIVLMGCGFLIFSLSRKSPQSAETQPSEIETVPASSEESVSSEPTLPPTVTIHYAAAGDLNITADTVQSGGMNYLYTDTFLDVASLLADAHLTSLNFEGTLRGAPYGSSFSAPQSMAQALSRAGVDLVQMANSYSITGGLSGLSASINSIRSAGMEALGVYENQKAFSQGKGYTIRTVEGIKLAFVAFTKGMDGMTLPTGSENCVNVLYEDYDSIYQKVDREKITSILSDVQKEQPDLVIALLHWGSEFNDTISSSQETIASLMFQNGVDAIIGTHSHYVQKMELDPETGKFLAYSLGDFFSNANRAGSEYSIILDLEITKDNVTGETKITDYSYTPIFTVRETGKPLKVVQIHQAMDAYENNHINKVSKDTYDAMAYALKRIEARVAGE
ncbi:MAG: CapA family protein [Oscillospiraceae bacterium]|nr:CapA family protein [Oscillospiraceae bacterium]